METRNSYDARSVIAEARNLMAEEAARRRVRMDVDVESDLPLVALDRVQIQQVLVNLIRNGMEAMDSVAGDRVLGVRVRRMGDDVQTEISDRGPGIEISRQDIRAVLHDERAGDGHGARDLPFDRRVAWRTAMGGEERTARSDVHLHVAG